jgi:hypothetical protein
MQETIRCRERSILASNIYITFILDKPLGINRFIIDLL